MSPVSCALSKMMLCLLKLMKHTVIWSLLYWRHSTWLGKLFLQEIFGVVLENFWWTNRVWQWQVDDFDDFDTKSANYQKHRVTWGLVSYWRHLWLGLVNYTFRKFLMGVVFKTHFKQTRMTLLQCHADDSFQKKANYQKCKWIFACQMILKSYSGNRHT